MVKIHWTCTKLACKLLIIGYGHWSWVDMCFSSPTHACSVNLYHNGLTYEPWVLTHDPFVGTHKSWPMNHDPWPMNHNPWIMTHDPQPMRNYLWPQIPTIRNLCEYKNNQSITVNQWPMTKEPWPLPISMTHQSFSNFNNSWHIKSLFVKFVIIFLCNIAYRYIGGQEGQI